MLDWHLCKICYPLEIKILSLSESSLGAQSFCWFCHEAAHLSEAASCSLYEPLRDKTNKVTVRPAKTQISLGGCPG